MDNHKEASSDTTGSPKTCNRLLCFSGQSSPTEYTSSERSDDQAPGRCEEVLESMCNHGAEFGGASRSNHLSQKRCNSPARPNGASLSDAGGRQVVRLVREFCSQNSDQHSQDADTLDSATNDSLSNERASAESKPQRSPEITTAKISAQEKVVVMKCMSRLDRAPKAANVAEGKLPQKACAAAVSSDRIPMVARESRPSQSPSLGCTNPARSAGLNSTSKRERYEEDKFGDMRLVVELDDSDDEDMANCSPRRLIAESDKTRSRHSCGPHHSNEDIEQQKLHLHKGGEEQLPARKMTLVVDLSENGSTIAGSAVYQARVGASMVAGNLPVLKKRRTSRDRLQDGLPVVVAAVKESDTVLFKTGRTRLANKNYYSMSTKLRSSVRAKTVSARKIRKLVLPEDEEEARQTILVAKKEESDDEASTLSGDYSRKHAGEDEREVFHPDWSPGVLCDLCEKGPSLTLGGWYSWCCGAPTPDCRCPQEEQMMKKKLAKWKGGKKWTKKDPVYPWSGKVHRLCALWSSEVYESEGLRLEQLMSAVQRSRRIKCSDADCGLFGATLGCRVKKCKKNFHYPCADKLAVKLHVRMWDGMKLPVACKEHRHANQVCMDYKPKKKRKCFKKGEDSVASKQRQNGCESGHQKRTEEEGGSFYQLATDQQLSIGTSKPANAPHEGPRIPAGAQVIDLYSSDDEQSPESGQAETNQKLYSGSPDTTVTTLMGQGVLSKAEKDSRWPNFATNPPSYLGKNLLCADFSRGREAVMVPCTNDVDDEPIPSLNYVTKSSFQGQPIGDRACQHPLLQRQAAKACKGCTKYNPDDPSAPISVHVPFQRREDDFREDWQKERMYGRLPYDQNARLVVGGDFNELVECNSKCGCGPTCINREMQRGLRTPLEMYKTTNKGWAVRTLVPIPRGRFVIEYVGEMLTQTVAHERGLMYDEIKRSYLYDLDYPESKRKPIFTLDGFYSSNVARFINHSCDANLKIYRVYVESTNKWLSHIGMYAKRDIEAGEELSYDYNYGKRPDLHVHDGAADNETTAAGKWQPVSLTDDHNYENDATHIKCYCGAHGCRKWLWRPCYAESETEGDGGGEVKV